MTQIAQTEMPASSVTLEGVLKLQSRTIAANVTAAWLLRAARSVPHWDVWLIRSRVFRRQKDNDDSSTPGSDE